MMRATYTSSGGDAVVSYTGAEVKELRKLYKDTGSCISVHQYGEGYIEVRERYRRSGRRFGVALI
jgi:hypothetical protein